MNEFTKNQINRIEDICACKKPLVVICCYTYNHQAYLRKALEGFAMQRTDFPFVAVVHDDVSTDGTTEILKEFAEKYADIILPIFEKENQYSKHDGSLGRIMAAARKSTGAKYVAFCEGDDYWTDPLKLQKQVDFLEGHPQYSMCFNKVEVVNEFSHRRYPLADVETREYAGSEIIESMMLQTASVVVRSSVFQSERYINAKKDKRFQSGDIVLYLSAATCGKIYCIADTMSVYRINSGGVTNTMRKDPFRFTYEVGLLNEHFGDKYGRSFKNNFAKCYLRTLAIGIREANCKIIGKSLLGVMKYIWFLKPSSVMRSFARKRHEI